VDLARPIGLGKLIGRNYHIDLGLVTYRPVAECLNHEQSDMTSYLLYFRLVASVLLWICVSALEHRWVGLPLHQTFTVYVCLSVIQALQFMGISNQRQERRDTRVGGVQLQEKGCPK
jgi:hypothetical protein